jgi:tetratricopeptide (TPR) repeat protein
LGLPATAILLHAVGQELAQQGRLDAALVHYSEALERMPPAHPHIASVRSALGELLARQGRHREAAEQLEEALRLMAGAVSPSHPFTAFTLAALATALQPLERYTEAVDAWSRALPVLERRLGAWSPRALAAHLALGRLYAAVGDPESALPHIERVLASANFGLGDARLLGLAQLTLGQIANLQGRPADALARFRRALGELDPHLSPGDPDLLLLLHDYGRTLHRAGDHEAALELFTRSLEGHLAAGSAETPAAATIHNALGQVYYSLGRFAQALERYHQSFDIRQRHLGPRHPQTVTARFNWGTAMRQLGDLFGLAEMEAAAEDLEEILGADHPQVLATRAWLR